MFTEMDFLFNTKYNAASITKEEKEEYETNTLKDGAKDEDAFRDTVSGSTTHNYTITTSSTLENYIKPLNKAYQANTKNPYIQLLEDFKVVENGVVSKSVGLTASDFTYLRDIGVFPINRLMILRRFPDGAIVPKNLNNGKFNVEPISTIVGWIKDDNDFLNFSISEKWVQQGSDKMLHLLLNDIFSKEFGINLDKIVPIPGWSVGFVFGFLNKMGITSFDGRERIPAGNPFVLRESLTRDFENFGLSSTFSFKLETCYEHKYINGVDLSTVNDILMDKILKMGSSDTQFIGQKGSAILNALSKANNKPSDLNSWITLTGIIIKRFKAVMVSELTALSSTIESVFTDLVPAKPEDDEEGKETEGKKEEKKTETTEGAVEEAKADKNKLADANYSIKTYTGFFNSGSSIVSRILTSTIGKYQWPIRGSLAMLTGDAVTPWHLTIGNPYSPLLSINNIIVEDLNVSYSGEMMYNDIPKYINLKIDIKQGRNMGKNEIAQMFNINYRRSYTEKK